MDVAVLLSRLAALRSRTLKRRGLGGPVRGRLTGTFRALVAGVLRALWRESESRPLQACTCVSNLRRNLSVLIRQSVSTIRPSTTNSKGGTCIYEQARGRNRDCGFVLSG